MRRKFNEVTDDKAIAAILTKSRIGRMATLGSDGFPYITPVNYVYHCEAIYFHCALTGEKLNNIARDPKVCFAVDRPLAYLDTKMNPEEPACEVGQIYESVVIRGRASIVTDPVEKVEALNALMASHENQPDYAIITADTPAVARCAVVKITVESLTAKANLVQRKTSEEKEKIRAYLTARNLPGDREAADLIK